MDSQDLTSRTDYPMNEYTMIIVPTDKSVQSSAMFSVVHSSGDFFGSILRKTYKFKQDHRHGCFVISS